MFDCSLLPAARLQFAVVADTHYMIDVGDAPLEFESRRVQGCRAGAAWRAIAALDPEFVVHMGDLVQEFPGRPDYARAVAEAQGQIADSGLTGRCRFVVGNHDIGDKPDPTMPTRPVSDAELDDWHDRHGPSWSDWKASGVRFFTLNSQILNTTLASATEQRAWIEQRLDAHAGEPCVLFIHLPPYLHDPDEPHLGHYDNIGEPDRSWLLDLVRRPPVIAVFTAHVHFQFYDHVPDSIGPCRYWVTPSTSFTRPGFSHLFNAPAPNEQGRDDAEKLGFFICRLAPDVDAGERLDVHCVRMTGLPAAGEGDALVTPVPAASTSPAEADFAVGVTLRHPLAPTGQVPIAWPSAIRQPVRNDYPLLSCIDLGAAWVRAPLGDLVDPVQARRLALLRADGVRVQAVALGEQEALRKSAALDGADRLEVQLPGRTAPDQHGLRQLAGIGVPLVFSALAPGVAVPGKQHRRTRVGYLPKELADLFGALEGAGVEATAACRLDDEGAWRTGAALADLRTHRDLVLLCEMPGVDDGANAVACARALLVAASLDAPVFLEPLVDLDRTMDVANGLLDALCNRRPTFDVARCMKALLDAYAVPDSKPVVNTVAGCEVAVLGTVTLVIPAVGQPNLGEVVATASGDYSVCQLARALVSAFDPERLVRSQDGPLLVYPSAAAAR